MTKVTISAKLANMGCTGNIEVRDENGVLLCAVRAVGGTRQRDMSNSYDRHRAIKEGTLQTLRIEGHEVEGDVQAVIDGIKKNLPACFVESGFAKPWDYSKGDGWEVFNFFRTLTQQGGWYGNTPAPVVRKIKNAWNKGIDFRV